MEKGQRSEKEEIYRRLSKILGYIAKNRLSASMLYRMYRKGAPPSWIMQPFRSNAVEIDFSCIQAWESIIRKHKYRTKKNKDVKSSNIINQMRKAKRKTTGRFAEMSRDYKGRANVQQTLTKILDDKDFFGKFFHKKTVAHRVDHLFISIEPDPEARYKRLVRIFGERHTIEDVLWVNIIWNHVKNKRYRLISDKIAKKVLPDKK
jgi:MFS superfamily sulfate permease-like transporter